VNLPATVVVLEESHAGGESYKHDVMMLVCEDLVFWDVALCAEAILLGWVPVHLVVR
jgi:hypothetical protein